MLLDGGDAGRVLAGAAGAVLVGDDVLAMLPQPTMPNIATATATVAVFIDLPPGTGRGDYLQVRGDKAPSPGVHLDYAHLPAQPARA